MLAGTVLQALAALPVLPSRAISSNATALRPSMSQVGQCTGQILLPPHRFSLAGPAARRRHVECTRIQP